ncbi:MAG: hypothetical protein ACREE0_08970 [Phenylobacterium sp.]
MLIRKTRVRQLGSYLGGLLPGTAFKLAVDLADVALPRLTASGFAGLSVGDALLPAGVGRTSRFNAEGKYVTHRDRPKENRSVGRREWTRQEWAGPGQTRTVTTEVDMMRDCYQRTFVPPPALELVVVEAHGSRLIVSETMTWGQTSDEGVLHAVNLFLELFGQCDVRHENLASLLPPNTRRVNWTMLPPGPQSLQAVLAHVQQLISRNPPTIRGPILSRIRFMAGLGPDEVYVGNGGFRAYVAYIFQRTGTAILESVMPDNATYVFDDNWQSVARLTKAQVLDGNHHVDRILHTEGWDERVRRYAPPPGTRAA